MIDKTQILNDLKKRLQNHDYEMRRNEEVLKTKLISRALKSENDIKEGKIYAQTEIEERINNVNRISR